MYYKPLASILALLLLTTSCAPNEGQTERDAPDSMNQIAGEGANPYGGSSHSSLDWAGTYSGVLPCADCPGIETVVTLRADGSYERSILYIDEAVIPYTDDGAFAWDETGSKIELDTGADEIVKYQVGENQLFHLDRDGQRISGNLEAHYVLQKHQQDSAIEGKRWKLIELRGNPVAPESDAVLMLSADSSVANGNSSCNLFSGIYAIKHNQRISFGRNMATTMMACPDMSIEQTFLETLQMADNYFLSDDGKLSLNRARMATLARFEEVEESQGTDR